MEILRENTVTTIKPHTCCGCGRIMPAGTKMYVQVNNLDGIQTWRVCLTCKELQGYHFYDEYIESGFSQEMKADDGFQGTYEEYLTHLQATYHKPGWYEQKYGFLWPKDEAAQEKVRQAWKFLKDFPYPHVHTPLPNGTPGHITSDRALTQEAMEVAGEVVEHFYHKENLK